MKRLLSACQTSCTVSAAFVGEDLSLTAANVKRAFPITSAFTSLAYFSNFFLQQRICSILIDSSTTSLNSTVLFLRGGFLLHRVNCAHHE